MSPVFTHRAVTAIGGGVIALGVGVLVGWALESDRVTTVYSGARPMVPFTASTFALSGVALLLRGDLRPRGSQRLGQVLAVLVAFAGAVVLVAFVAGTDPERLAAGALGLKPAPTTAIGFLLFGATVALFDVRFRRTRVSDVTALLLALVALLGLATHAYGLPGLYAVSAVTGMAIHTGGVLLALSVAAVFARPGSGLSSLLLGRTAGSRLTRAVLPLVVLIPFGLGWLAIAALRAGLLGLEAALAVAVAGIVGTLTAVLLLGMSVASRAGENFRQSEERYRLFFERNPAGAFRVRRDATVLEVNWAFAEILGYDSPDEIRSLPVTTFYARPEDRAAVLAELAAGPVVGRTVRLRRKDGREIDAALTFTEVKTIDGPVLEGQLIDVTAQREAEQLRTIARLANAASHEINNPLVIISGQLEFFASEAGMTPAVLARIDKMEQAVRRITETITHMTRITRVEAVQGMSDDLPPMLDIRKSATPPDGPTSEADPRGGPR